MPSCARIIFQCVKDGNLICKERPLPFHKVQCSYSGHFHTSNGIDHGQSVINNSDLSSHLTRHDYSNYVTNGGCQYGLTIPKIVVNFCQINWYNPTSSQAIYILILWDLQETGTTTWAEKSLSLAIFYWASHLSGSHFVQNLYVIFFQVSSVGISSGVRQCHCEMEEEKHQNCSIAGSSGPLCKWFVTSLPTYRNIAAALMETLTLMQNSHHHPWLHGKIRCKDIKRSPPGFLTTLPNSYGTYQPTPALHQEERKLLKLVLHT
jgi:hypothetical protein